MTRERGVQAVDCPTHGSVYGTIAPDLSIACEMRSVVWRGGAIVDAAKGCGTRVWLCPRCGLRRATERAGGGATGPEVVCPCGGTAPLPRPHLDPAAARETASATVARFPVREWPAEPPYRRPGEPLASEVAGVAYRTPELVTALLRRLAGRDEAGVEAARPETPLDQYHERIKRDTGVDFAALPMPAGPLNATAPSAPRKRAK